MPVDVPRIVEEFADRTEDCASLAELATLVEDAAREIGFDYYALTFCDNLQQTEPRFGHLDNYPAVYAEIFVAQRLYRIDPILHAAQRRIGGFAWEAVAALVPLASGQVELLARAAREGLRDGYTIPANVPGEPCGTISFATRQQTRLTSERAVLRRLYRPHRLRGFAAAARPVLRGGAGAASQCARGAMPEAPPRR